MRCYHLNNFYLSGIHAGIQSSHAQTELAIKYLATSLYIGGDESVIDYMAREEVHVAARKQYVDWATKHKTMVVLNGGMMAQLLEWEELLGRAENRLAWASFREEEGALNNALTNVCIVLPERMYVNNQIICRLLNAPTRREIDGYNLEAADSLGLRTLTKNLGSNSAEIIECYTGFELELIQKLNNCRLM